MKFRSLLVALNIIASTCVVNAVGPQATPLRSVFEDLSSVKSILEKDKAVLPPKAVDHVLALLSKAETEIAIMKEDKAIYRPAFKKAVEEAKGAVAGAKSDPTQRDIAMKAVDKALKATSDMINYHRK